MLKNNGFHNRHSPILRAFSPLSLFSGGSPGAWYDPSDLTTLFQDSAGTTPVTAVEQPVGLMLDKSQGLVLGSDVVVNGNFSGGSTGWFIGTSWAIAGGSVNGVATSALFYQTNANIIVNRYYEVTFTVSNYVAGSVRPFLGATVTYGTFVSGNGTYTQRFCPVINGNELGFQGSVFTGSIDNIIVKAVAGNHAFQATSASRPVLSARYNLLTKTEQFDDAVWGKFRATVTANAIVAPNGTTTADKLVATNVSGSHGIGQTVGALPCTVFNYFKAGEYSHVAIGFNAGTPSITTDSVFNIATGALVSAGSDVASYNIVDQGNGWYQIFVTASGTATLAQARFAVMSNSTTISYTGDNTSGIYIWGASLVPANQSTLPYQRVNTATDYNTTGFLPYLRFDGVDDSLSTNSISFTSTDKMSVFAGVRSLTGGQYGALVELSVNADDNAGTVLMSGNGNLSTYRVAFTSRGTASGAALANSTTYNPPVTLVQAGLGDILGDRSTLRINGTQVVQSTADQGTGNYGNYPLFIGRRGGSSLPFNGQLYSMVIVGKAVTAGELSSTETYVNQKTGAY